MGVPVSPALHFLIAASPVDSRCVIPAQCE